MRFRKDKKQSLCAPGVYIIYTPYRERAQSQSRVGVKRWGVRLVKNAGRGREAHAQPPTKNMDYRAVLFGLCKAFSMFVLDALGGSMSTARGISVPHRENLSMERTQYATGQ